MHQRTVTHRVMFGGSLEGVREATLHALHQLRLRAQIFQSRGLPVRDVRNENA